MPNKNETGPPGSPVLKVESQYPNFHYLRVKVIEDNPHFNPDTKKRRAPPHQWC
ncbi:hypothetical protein NX059_008979 [Plenodomus lindquistii]|nr:hypothetical protein NX059_008979 [Plenodomus lindquistii]